MRPDAAHSASWRRYLVISIAMVGAVVHAEGGRIVRAHIAVGSCSPVARRLVALETALVGAALGDVGGIVGQARLDELTPIDDVRASAAYRMDAVRTLVRRTVLDAVEKTDVA